MPEKTIKRRLTEAGVRELADDDGPIFSTVAKLVDALQRAVPHSRDLELREEALRLASCSAGPSTSRSDDRTADSRALAARLRRKMLGAGVPASIICATSTTKGDSPIRQTLATPMRANCVQPG